MLTGSFTAFFEDFGLSKDEALKIGACFGRGMRKGEVCGACTGALMVLGLRYGDDKSKSNEICEMFLDEFESENGSYICRDLLNCDISTEEVSNMQEKIISLRDSVRKW